MTLQLKTIDMTLQLKTIDMTLQLHEQILIPQKLHNYTQIISCFPGNNYFVQSQYFIVQRRNEIDPRPTLYKGFAVRSHIKDTIKMFHKILIAMFHQTYKIGFYQTYKIECSTKHTR